MKSAATQVPVVGQEIALKPPVSTATPLGAVHAVPSYVRTLPAPSTAAQNVGVGQETEASPWFVVSESIFAAADHALPVQVNAVPSELTATQNLLDEHETLPSPPFGLTLIGAVHLLPLKIMAFPDRSTAAQNVADGHDTDDNLSEPFATESIFAAGDQAPER